MTGPVLADEKLFVGGDAWVIVPDPDLLLWWEGEQIRIDKIGGAGRDMQTGEQVDVYGPIYLAPWSMAWEQAAQQADEED